MKEKAQHIKKYHQRIKAEGDRWLNHRFGYMGDKKRANQHAGNGTCACKHSRNKGKSVMGLGMTMKKGAGVYQRKHEKARGGR